MACYLVYTSPARGHLYPIVPALQVLRERGHDVHVRTLGSEVPVLADLGMEAAPIAPAIEDAQLDDWKATTPTGAMENLMAVFGKRAELELHDLRSAIDSVRPDALVVDITTPGAAAVAEASDLPWARWIPFFLHTGLVPDLVRRAAFLPFALHPSGLEVLNECRVAAGLPGLARVDDAWTASLELYLTAPPFEPGAELPAAVKTVGPGIWEPPAEVPSSVEDLPGPLVLVSASTEYQRDDALIGSSLAGLGGEDLGIAVATVAHDPSAFDAPPNASVVRWFPHGPLLDRAACVVCHGGMGVTQKALAAGVPVCVVPFGRDQFDVAQRVVETGSGTMVPPDSLTPEALRDAVHQAISLRAGASAVRQGFRRAGGPELHADVIEAVAGTPALTP
jgi:MGT family glycosyltransferase